MNLQKALQLRDLHVPRQQTRWRQLLGRPARCQACGDTSPCAPHRFAKARLLQLIEEAFSSALDGRS